MDYDYIVVGGGSSGCVIASRLSAGKARILLIEAGPDTPPGAVPDDILDGNPTRAYFNPDYQWPDLKASFASGSRRTERYEQARVMGGGSSINAQVANRGDPADYDAWAKAGAAGWNWEQVLPYFIKLETDHDYRNAIHGSSGPLPIRRVRQDEWSGFIRALTKAYEANGLPFKPDYNGGFADGYSPVPLTNRDGRRVSAAMAYLTAEVRARSNLTILSKTHVARLILSGRQVTGVVATGAEGEKHITGGTVIMCAGAIHTPAILLRSGIGPAEQLRHLGIDVTADVPGVGAGLQEHPSIAVSTYLRPEHRMAPHVSGHIQVHARYSSNVPGCPPADMAISAVAKSAWHPLGMRLGSLQLWVNRSYSVGSVQLKSTDPGIEPAVTFNWLSDERDMARLKRGAHLLGRILTTGNMAQVALDPFPSAWNARSKRISTMSRLNYVLTSILAAALDSSTLLRRGIIKHVIAQGTDLHGLLADEQALECYIRRNVTGNWHPTSTCRMGAEDDPTSVTDSEGRVRAVANLRVADASVMPFCPKANTNLPTIMVAEKMADAILSGTR